MEFYQINLVVFVLVNAGLIYREYRKTEVVQETPKEGEDKGEAQNEAITRAALKKFKWNFIPIYLLVNGADWLQGPYIYPLYKDEKGLAEEVVAALFMTGFLAGAVSASFTGKLADRYGRKMACLAFCVTYSLSCFALLTNDLLILFLGRVLGGISTTLMYSVFESWMVTEYNKAFPEEPGSTLSGIFSIMTTLNTIVAIFAGVIAEGVVNLVKTETAPFMTSALVLMTAFVAIWKKWSENYGDNKESESSALLDEEGGESQTPPVAPKSTLRLFLDDKRLIALGVTSCFFEGSMYIFIFFKFPALKMSRQLAGGDPEDLPFGLIFAILMCSMMLGSLLFNHLSAHHSTIPPSKILITTLTTAAISFYVPLVFRDERITFWCFCIFEVCCGVYFPAMAYQKGKVVDDGVRANVYGLMRVPLNIFVVLVLSTTREGVRHRDIVFSTCSGLLFAAVGVNSLIL